MALADLALRHLTQPWIRCSASSENRTAPPELLLRWLSRRLARAEKTVSSRPENEATRLTVVEAGGTLVSTSASWVSER